MPLTRAVKSGQPNEVRYKTLMATLKCCCFPERVLIGT